MDWKEYLNSKGYNIKNTHLLPKDCSARYYIRLGDAKLLMVWPIDKGGHDGIKRFVKLSSYLNTIGIKAPTAYDYSITNGMAIIEDLGTLHYRDLISSNSQYEEAYITATKLLIHLHKQNNDEGFSDYTLDRMLQEISLFLEWGLPHDYCLSDIAIKEWFAVWSDIISNALNNLPFTLVLRDFHADNLLWQSDNSCIRRCGVIDFEDAAWGPGGYDFISLIEDERYDMQTDFQKYLWEEYAKGCGFSETTFKDINALGLARHFKNIGVFERMDKLYNNPKYLNHLPRMWNYILPNLELAQFARVKIWLQKWHPDFFKKVAYAN